MLALYRSGRQADALEAYRHAREVLVEQLGIEPGAELHDLHEAILAHDSRDRRAASRRPLADARAARHGRAGDSAGAAESDGRSRARARRDRRAAARRVGAAADAHRAGGVGKTRLALEAARSVEADFADGARFVSLAALQRSEDVPAAIVRALGIVVLAGESAEQAVERFLAAQAAAARDRQLRARAGRRAVHRRRAGVLSRASTVLATSREPLALQAEERYPVPPLALPETAVRGGDVARRGRGRAVRRARAGARSRRLSWAAATPPRSRRSAGGSTGCRWRSSSRPPAAGCCRPPRSRSAWTTALGALGAGARDAPARQQTLRATIDWSHELLSEDEKACFARFAVFAGGATVEAAEAITGADLDTLDRLVAKSLLVRRRQRTTARRG